MSAQFAERIREATDEKGCTQADIARAVKTSRATVSHWFSGRVVPGGRNLATAAEFLGVRAPWLAGEDGPKAPAGNGSGNGTDRPIGRNNGAAKLVGLFDASPHVGKVLLERIARHFAALDGSELNAAANSLAEDMKAALMDLHKELMELAAAWLAMPEKERDIWKKQLESASIEYRREGSRETLQNIKDDSRDERNGAIAKAQSNGGKNTASNKPRKTAKR